MADDLKQQNGNDNALQGGESNDRISSFHDSLLHHILSYLPTRDVIRTGILSKRWKSLWTGVPRLEFVDRLFIYSRTEFLNIVESVLLHRDGTSIPKFRLLLSDCFSWDYSRVQSLITAAVSHIIQQLDIDIHIDYKSQFTLPCSIFDCQTLGVLKLSLNCSLKLPSRISLPRLKVLHLRHFEFPNAKSTENLFSCCPVLEELTLVKLKCRLIHLNGINIYIPSLKSLAMDYSVGKKGIVNDPDSCHIQVEVPALRFFNYKGKLTSRLKLSKTSSIENFQLSLSDCVSSDYPCVQTLIAAAVTHKLQQLDITVYDKHQFALHFPIFDLPFSIFDCQSLRILKLSMKCTIELPSHISLPCLKVLHLCSFAFPNAKSIEKLFSCCHVLEELALSKCRWIHRDSVNISIPSLKSLTLDNSLEKYDSTVDDPNNSCYIKVEAPGLRFFKCKGKLTSHFTLSTASSIEIIQLSHSCSVSSEYSRVQSLIAAAVSHKIQQIDISIFPLFPNDPFVLPCSVFDCQSLRILKIEMSYTLVLPDNISLPSLKAMYLYYFAFQNAKSIEKLFSCCPVLEELTLENCKWKQPRSITISIPSLSKLTIFYSLEEYDGVDDPNGCSITVDAPALMYFNYTGHLTNHFYLANMSSSSTSIEACINITEECPGLIECVTYKEELAYPHLVELLWGLENMVSLTISDKTAELLSRALADKVSDDLPVFHHLKHLDLNMYETECVSKLFYSTPNLCSIKFSKGFDDTIRQAGISWMPKPLPGCFSSSLKTLSLGDAVGDSDEFFLLTSFLEKVVSLERINIFQENYRLTYNQVQLRSVVERLSKRFKHCEIIVH